MIDSLVNKKMQSIKIPDFLIFPMLIIVSSMINNGLFDAFRESNAVFEWFFNV
ncbi:hypothetical protein [Myroides sp. LJL110]